MRLKKSEEENELIRRGGALSELEQTEGYRLWLDECYNRLYRAILEAASAHTTNEALRGCARLGQILEMIDVVGLGRSLGERVEADFRARYEEDARREREAQRRAQRGGMRAGRSSVPSL